MPTPIEILLDPVSLAILLIYAALMLWEAVFPAVSLPKIPWWRTRALSVFVVYFYLATYLPMWWDPILAPYQLFDITHLGTWGGAALLLILFEGLVYFWHRAMHSNNALWRIFHQMHHSAERMDTYGAFFFSPTDIAGFAFLGSIAGTLIMGGTPQAITVYLLVSIFLVVFQHSNIKTARWIGYIIQRPESHSIHHARRIHYKNFSDLPIFDIIFGTFENPKEFNTKSGFYDGASAKIWDMLLFKNITKMPRGQVRLAKKETSSESSE